MSWSNLFLQVVEDVLQVAKGQGGDEDTRIDAHGYACTDSSWEWTYSPYRMSLRRLKIVLPPGSTCLSGAYRVKVGERWRRSRDNYSRLVQWWTGSLHLIPQTNNTTTFYHVDCLVLSQSNNQSWDYYKCQKDIELVMSIIFCRYTTVQTHFTRPSVMWMPSYYLEPIFFINSTSVFCL